MPGVRPLSCLSSLLSLQSPQDVPLSTKRVCLDRDDHSIDKIPIEPLLGVISRGLRIVLMEMMPVDTFINVQVLQNASTQARHSDYTTLLMCDRVIQNGNGCKDEHASQNVSL